jgi:hypothetical protein
MWLARGAADPTIGRAVVCGVHVSRTHRQAIWSDGLTSSLASVIPAHRRPAALHLVKAIHTAAFVIISGAIAVFAWDGLTRRHGHRAKVAATIAITESIVYAGNNQVCPLTPLAEALGAESGSVTDIYLPKWISERVPLIGGSTLVLGIALHLVAWRGSPKLNRPSP